MERGMSAERLLPAAFWFRFAVHCPAIEYIPLAGQGGRLLDLPETHALPDLRQLEGETSWAQVRVAWNPRGLGFTVLAEGVSEKQLDPARPEGFAAADFWVDTRDTRNVARATRFCHHFNAVLRRAKAPSTLDVEVRQKKIPRANADAAICDPELLSARGELFPSGWILELWLPAEAMKGFDHELNRRLGFAYKIADFVRTDQYFTVGAPEFPVAENPSLWSTLELCD
jgi:hypothetical protein